MTKYYSARQIVNRLPSTTSLSEITRALPDTPFTYIGSGAFRNVYAIGFEHVIKIPITWEHQLNPLSESGNSYYDNYSADKDHSLYEWNAYIDIKTAGKRNPLSRLKPYIPKIHYFGSSTRVILMDKYPLLKRGDPRIKRLRDLVHDSTGNDDADVWAGNVGVNKYGTPILLDLGCVHDS